MSSILRMKREVVFIMILFSLILIPVINADETTQINNAYSCLNNLINYSTCVGTNMSFEQKTFSLLSVGKCYTEVSQANSSEECWPKNDCGIKSTAQALLSLENYNTNYNTTAGEEWLFSHKIIPEGLQWFLEIESNERTSCTVYYEGNEQGSKITIEENKTISSLETDSCLTIANQDYLLEVSPSCYNMNIDISCDQGFLTTLLFKQEGSTAIHIVDKIHESSAKGLTTEKVNSWCFSDPISNSCDYEGSLWAAEALFYLGQDVTSFLPYLVAFSESNSKYIPESFLYYLTGEYRSELLYSQVRGKYWINSGDEYYDTAVALFPLQYESPLEKQDSKSWLLDVQNEDGCWDNDNLRNTAFILASIWPRSFTYGGSSGSGVVCGDGVVNGTEECDGTNLDGETCLSLGFSNSSGDLGCYSKRTSRECEFDESECVVPSECDPDNDDCPKGYACSTGGQCLKESTSGNYECTRNSDCANSNEECINNICVEKSLDCEDEGYFCMSAISCDGSLLSGYSCNTPYKCCSKKISYGTCSSQDGKICSYDETCDGNEINADGLSLGESCCIGTCKDSSGNNAALCSANSGTCRSS